MCSFRIDFILSAILSAEFALSKPFRFAELPLFTVLLVLLDGRHLVVEENECVGIGFVSNGLLLLFCRHWLVKKIAFVHLQNILVEFVHI